MIRIKAVDAQNIFDVCKLTTNQNGVGTTMEEYLCCNAISIAEAKYYPEMHPNAIFLCISVQKVKPIQQPFVAL